MFGLAAVSSGSFRFDPCVAWARSVSSAAMEIFDGYRALFRPLVTPAVALGNFDGVHRGHQALLAAATSAADQLGGDAVVYTFDPHPARVLAPAHAPPLITPRARKLELLAAAGVSACVLEPFTHELAAMEPDEFLTTIVEQVLGARHIVVGYDFTYGRKRAGTTDDLRAFGRARGVAVDVIDAVELDGEAVSSTRVRELIGAGDVAAARRLLGRGFDIDGEVIRGDGRGASIGVPTANIAPTGELMPKGGVYAVRAQVLERGAGAASAGDTGVGASASVPGVANLGTKPTFGDASPQTLEVHLFDLSADLYGATLRVSFVERLRGEQRFDGVDALIAQIHADSARARAILAADAS